MNLCDDNRTATIEAAKTALIKETNIEDSPEEMKVLDSFLLRCWQMGWLDRYEPTIEQSTNCSKFPNNSETISRKDAIEVVQNRPMMLSKEKVLLINDLEKLPPAEPKRETTTLRIGRTRNSVTMWYECAECGEPVDKEDAFCRRCGRGIIHG